MNDLLEEEEEGELNIDSILDSVLLKDREELKKSLELVNAASILLLCSPFNHFPCFPILGVK